MQVACVGCIGSPRVQPLRLENWSESWRNGEGENRVMEIPGLAKLGYGKWEMGWHAIKEGKGRW